MKFTGSLHNVDLLPLVEVKGNGIDDYLGLRINRRRLGNNIKIEAQLVNSSVGDQYIEYRSLSQSTDGSTTWLLKWKHKKYGTGERTITYKGKAVYAIKKSDFKFGLIPPNKED